MYKIEYTLKTNIAKPKQGIPGAIQNNIIDPTLVLTAQAADDTVVNNILNTNYVLLSKWNTLDYDRILINNKKAMKKELKTIIPARPGVPLTLASGKVITIDGGRVDKDNLKEEYERLLRNNLQTTMIKDATNKKHQVTIDDIRNGYIAIIDNYRALLGTKWTNEDLIDNSTELAKLSLLHKKILA